MQAIGGKRPVRPASPRPSPSCNARLTGWSAACDYLAHQGEFNRAWPRWFQQDLARPFADGPASGLGFQLAVFVVGNFGADGFRAEDGLYHGNLLLLWIRCAQQEKR